MSNNRHSGRICLATAYSANVNRLPVSVSAGNGSGTLSASSAFTYDDVGNRLTEDGPLDGAADTVRYRFNAARELVGS